MSFMAAFTRLSADFDPGIAIDPHDMAGSAEQLIVEVEDSRHGLDQAARELLLVLHVSVVRLFGPLL
ncbi:MAG TPA: hypothetical protein VFN67_31335 [Polyangiales bacterium]|nr:hypothetical protein [Polyangiales bacterium]